MITLIKQELYKLLHKKGTWLAVIFMVAVQIGFAILGKQYPKIFTADALFGEEYIGGELVIFIMIASCAGMIAMEFQYGTIKQLLYRQYYRSQVFTSKIIVMVLQLLALQAIASGVTFALTLALFPKFDLQQAAGQGHTLFENYWINIGGATVVTLLILSVVVLLATLFKSNATAIATGYIGYFVSMLASELLLLLVHQWHYLKWNPFTMLLVQDQIQNPKVYSQATYLSTNVMILCALGYTVLFTFIAYLSFRRRSV